MRAWPMVKGLSTEMVLLEKAHAIFEGNTFG